MSTDRLAEFLEPMGAAINYGPFPDLWQSLMTRVTTGDRIVVFGSFFRWAKQPPIWLCITMTGSKTRWIRYTGNGLSGLWYWWR